MTDARSLRKEAFAHFTAGRLEQAIAAYRQAVEADPELAIAWNGLSMALLRHGNLDGAIAAGQRLVELEPADPLSHTNLSRLYQQKGLIPEAEDEAAEAMRLSREQS